MAQVFLSYDREDGAKAKAIAQSLERAGHFVWWDLHIKGGAEYGKVIEEALEAADAVVVLWSSKSVDSAWVRDEAAAGRDKGCLIPVLLEPLNPPMGFRQYQNLDFSGWKGRGRPPRLPELLDSIATVAEPATAQPQPITSRPSPPSAKNRTLPKWAIIAGTILLGLVAIGLFIGLVLSDEETPRIPVVAIEAADRSPSSAVLARDLRSKLAGLQSASAASMNLLDESAGASSADLVLKVANSAGTNGANASLLLLKASDRSILWSRQFEVPSERRADLEQQLAVSAGRLIGCAAEGLASKQMLTERTFKLYLNGCDQMADVLGLYNQPVIPLFLQVTQDAPKFVNGWSKLLLAEAQVVANELAPNSESEESLSRHIAAARALDPNLAEASYAEIVLSASGPLDRQIALSRAAIGKHPSHPFLLQQAAWLSSSVGHMKLSIELARRAAESDPLSIRARSDYISMLGYAGQIDVAQSELAAAEKIWPKTVSVLDARYRLDSRYGDPHRALEIDRSGFFGQNEMMQAFLAARISPTTAHIDRAVAATKAQIGRDPRAIGYLIQTWGEFGRVDEIYAAMEHWKNADLKLSSMTFFRPPLRQFRHDRRFMRIAKRAGLADYWRQTGNWPDFCFEPDLPYDCKAEAAKLR